MTHNLITSREIRLVFRPQGVPVADNFALVETEVPALQEGQVMVRNHFIPVDSYMRGRMNDTKSIFQELPVPWATSPGNWPSCAGAG